MKKVGCFLLFLGVFLAGTDARGEGNMLNVLKKLYPPQFSAMVQGGDFVRMNTPYSGEGAWSFEVYRGDLVLKGGRKDSMPVIVLNLDGKKFIVPVIFSVEEGKNYGLLWGFHATPAVKLPHSEKHLVSGGGNCTHSVSIFSDPECSFCQKLVPLYIDLAAQRDFCVYYHHYPLKFHKNARKLSRFMYVAMSRLPVTERSGFLKKFYGKSRSVEEAEKLALETFKAHGGNEKDFYRLASGEADDVINADLDLGQKANVAGTPTFFVNGRKVNNSVYAEILDMVREK